MTRSNVSSSAPEQTFSESPEKRAYSEPGSTAPGTRRPPLIVLAGPTGVGKTDLSLRLSARLRTDIINADSMQVYRYLDIGTAKPTPEQRAMAAHHLWDVVSPDQDFDAARYARLARATVDALYTVGKIPLLVGGTGLYLKALEKGLCPGPPSDLRVRQELRNELTEHGPARLHRLLRDCDPESAEKLHPNDRQRVLRALEVFRLSGIPLSRWQSHHRFRQSRYAAIKIFLDRDRTELYDRIDARVRIMINQGFLDEVRSLLARGFGPELKSMQSLGYRHMCRYLKGERSWTETIEDIQRDTRRYAKRQFTWFRADPDYHWLHADDENGIWSYIKTRQVEDSHTSFTL
jgi:tRNA dimethylallyltransferase